MQLSGLDLGMIFLLLFITVWSSTFTIPRHKVFCHSSKGSFPSIIVWIAKSMSAIAFLPCLCRGFSIIEGTTPMKPESTPPSGSPGSIDAPAKSGIFTSSFSTPPRRGRITIGITTTLFFRSITEVRIRPGDRATVPCFHFTITNPSLRRTGITSLSYSLCCFMNPRPAPTQRIHSISVHCIIAAMRPIAAPAIQAIPAGPDFRFYLFSMQTGRQKIAAVQIY